jgi:hypothetical protein
VWLPSQALDVPPSPNYQLTPYPDPISILSMDEMPMGEDGIKQVNIVDFLLEE